MRGPEVRGRLDWMLFLTMASAWALNYPLSKIALGYVDPFQLTFLRFAAALPFMAALMPRSARPLRGLRSNLLVALFGALDLLAASLLWFMGERYTTPSVASIIIYTYPVLITAMGSAILGERMGRRRASGIALGFLGIALMFSSDVRVYGALGPLLLLGAALSFSAAAILYRKCLIGEDFARVNFYHMAFAALMAAALVSVTGPPSPPALMGLLPVLIVMSFPGTAVAYTIYVYLYSRHEVTEVAPYLFLVPALSVILSYLMLGVAIAPVELAGFLPLAAGIYLSSLER